MRWLAVLRVVVLLNAVGLALVHAGDVDRPLLGLGCVAVMVGWTAVATWAYVEPRRRVPLLLGLDLGVAVGLIVVTPLVTGPEVTSTVPGFWVMGALLAWSVHFRWVGGLLAGLLLATADLTVRSEVTRAAYGNVFLLLLGGVIVGFMVESLQRMAADRDRAEREAAAAAERARLARAVHDGVLQVLALVQRRGGELGGEAAELGRLAGEQEAALRLLIREQAAATTPGVAGDADLGAALTHLESRPGVVVVTPGTPVEVPARTAAELTAAVGACLDNVRAHVGDDAPAWVLLEALPDHIGVSVRDEGPGIAPGRLQAAAAEGRLGVSASIRGRVSALGGTATLLTGAGGTEWELVVPRPPEQESTA